MAKPFLLLQLRPEDTVSDGEYEAFCRYGKLLPSELHRLRIETGWSSHIKVDSYAGILVGGGPCNVSDPEYEKSDGQRDAERGLRALIHEVVDRDMPYLGTCYGLGILAQHLGAVVSKERYGEAVGSVTRTVTAEGKCDPLLAGLPETFRAFCRHNRSVPGAATSCRTPGAV